MEAIVAPIPSWGDFPDEARETFQAMRSSAGEEMILENNLFVEAILPGSILRDLSDEEIAEYRRPFTVAGEDRRPTLTFPRQIPIEGEPSDVFKIVSEYSQWLTNTPLPTLFINANPGVLISGSVEDLVRRWKNLTEVVVPGLHFVQEDSPDEIGMAIADWMVNR